MNLYLPVNLMRSRKSAWKPSLMSGSLLVSGSCHARLDKVGADSYISQLTLEAKAIVTGGTVGDDPFPGQAGKNGRNRTDPDRNHFVCAVISIIPKAGRVLSP